MKTSLLCLFLATGASSYSLPRPARVVKQASKNIFARRPSSSSTARYISTGDDQSEQTSLDISKTTYTSNMKSPKDSYLAFAEKGASNAKMAKTKILHQSILGGAYVGFGGLLSFCIAGNLGGISAANPGVSKMAFAALFPVNLLLVLTTGGQLFTGNTATVSAAKYEGLVTWRELWKSWGVSLLGNVIGCSLFAVAAWYVGLLTGGTADLCINTALNKCRGTFGQTMVKAVLCNWMVSLAVFLAGASNDLVGKLVGVWFPISTFVAIGLEHSVANLFIMPAAMLLKVKLSITDVMLRNVIPVIIGNTIAGAFVVSGSYSYQFGQLGRPSLIRFKKRLDEYEARKKQEKAEKDAKKVKNEIIVVLPNGLKPVSEDAKDTSQTVLQ